MKISHHKSRLAKHWMQISLWRCHGNRVTEEAAVNGVKWTLSNGGSERCRVVETGQNQHSHHVGYSWYGFHAFLAKTSIMDIASDMIVIKV